MMTVSGLFSSWATSASSVAIEASLSRWCSVSRRRWRSCSARLRVLMSFSAITAPAARPPLRLGVQM